MAVFLLSCEWKEKRDKEAKFPGKKPESYYHGWKKRNYI
jgi:hypothetical protein